MPPLLAIAFPNIDPVIVQFGPFALRWYALAYVGGLLLGWYLTKRLVTRPGWRITPEDVDDLLFFITLGVILGGRLGYVLFYNLPSYLENPAQILMVWQGGMSFHGGLIGVLVAMWWFARSRRVPFLDVADAVAAVTPLGLLFGRIANFINGELYGRVTDLPFGVVFPNGGPEPRHASQLYEAFLEGLVLLIAVQWLALRPRTPEDRGLIGGTFLFGYGLARFLVEFAREPDAQLGYLMGGLTMGQLLSLPVALVGLWLILRTRRAVRPA
ncbi:prolipoprotein diacylglyceryl transferase [Geminicoccus roseus]|uniref:prolipoprotein diacylglyceryl transferase n=1 Tax=Geminicoccus roseus TaxID=404900 RepID=UPI000551EE51|nr:prolipoprotein diacylglyceryl transferase [Geminicoccus roseus]